MSFRINARTAVRNAALACASVALLVPAAQAHGHFSGRGGGGAYVGHPGFHGGYYGHRHGYYPRGWGWGGVGVGLGLGLGLGLSSYYYDYPGRDYVIVEPPVVYDTPRPVPQVTYLGPAQPAQPVIYPRNGQDAARIEADSDACSQWAGSQPNATKDASVFRRAIEACMDARGYTLR